MKVMLVLCIWIHWRGAFWLACRRYDLWSRSAWHDWRWVFWVLLASTKRYYV